MAMGQAGQLAWAEKSGANIEVKVPYSKRYLVLGLVGLVGKPAEVGALFTTLLISRYP